MTTVFTSGVPVPCCPEVSFQGTFAPSPPGPWLLHQPSMRSLSSRLPDRNLLWTDSPPSPIRFLLSFLLLFSSLLTCSTSCLPLSPVLPCPALPSPPCASFTSSAKNMPAHLCIWSLRTLTETGGHVIEDPRSRGKQFSPVDIRGWMASLHTMADFSVQPGVLGEL